MTDSGFWYRLVAEAANPWAKCHREGDRTGDYGVAIIIRSIDLTGRAGKKSIDDHLGLFDASLLKRFGLITGQGQPNRFQRNIKWKLIRSMFDCYPLPDQVALSLNETRLRPGPLFPTGQLAANIIPSADIVLTRWPASLLFGGPPLSRVQETGDFIFCRSFYPARGSSL